MLQPHNHNYQDFISKLVKKYKTNTLDTVEDILHSTLFVRYARHHDSDVNHPVYH